MLYPGKITEVAGLVGTGMTRLGLGMLVSPARLCPVVAVDVKGWLSPLAAWELGIPPEHFLVVRCPDPDRWPEVMAALMEGMEAIYAEVPVGADAGDLRRLAAVARSRRVGVVLRPLRGRLPSGVAFLSLTATESRWEGVEGGYGRLTTRRLVVEATGKAVGGMRRRIELVDDGADIVRVVSRVGERAVG